MMFGYATNETPELMADTLISLAHGLAQKLSEVRKSGKMAYLRPDGKSQVTVEYDSNHKPVRVDAVVISTQHAEEVADRDPSSTLSKRLLCRDPGARHPGRHPGRTAGRRTPTCTIINPTGRFVIGGPMGDSESLTGPARSSSTLYGGMGRHGGGAFSRQGCNQGRPLGGLHGALHCEERCSLRACRPLRGTVGLRDRCGRSGQSIRVDTFGTGKVGEQRLVELVRENFKLTPKGIIESLNLRRPVFKKIGCLWPLWPHWGHLHLGSLTATRLPR